MATGFGPLLKNRAGSLAITWALTAPVVLAGLGVCIDYLMLSRTTTHLQAAADAAALSSVKELGLSGLSNEQIKAIGVSFTEETLSRWYSESEIDATAINVDVDNGANSVEVAVTMTWSPFMLHMFDAKATPVTVRARANNAARRLACVLGLSKVLPAGVELWSDARLSANNCNVYSNTELPTGLIVKDDATLRADMICVSGGYVALRPKAVSPDPITDCPAFEDPLASRSAPKVGLCDHLAKVILNKTVTLDPGVYCGGLAILGTSKVTLNPGVYIIHNGLLKVGDKAQMTGENVGFYLSGLLTLMQFDSDTTIDLTAPKSGPLAGILFFEDRKAPPLRVHRIGSNNARNLLGTIYLPVGTLLVDANAPVADQSAYTAIVAYSLQLQEGPDLQLNGDYDSTDVPVPEGLIVSRAVLTQ